jgi:fluoride exporter
MRHGLLAAFPAYESAFPFVTLTENVAGAFLLGVVLTALLRSPVLAARWRPFLATGVLGSFTTFSTLSLQVVELVRDGGVGLAAGYVGASIGAGLFAAAVGVVLGARLMDRFPVDR